MGNKIKKKIIYNMTTFWSSLSTVATF